MKVKMKKNLFARFKEYYGADHSYIDDPALQPFCERIQGKTVELIGEGTVKAVKDDYNFIIPETLT